MENITMTFHEAEKTVKRWGCELGFMRIFRCEAEGVCWEMQRCAGCHHIQKMEAYAEYLPKLGHPLAYLVCAVRWNEMAENYTGEEKRKYCKAKAMECVKKSIERKENDIDFFCVKFLAENGEIDEAMKLCEEIAKNTSHESYDTAKKYLRWQKKRNSFLGKYDVGVYKFWEKPGLHLLYLALSCLLVLYGVGVLFLGLYVVKKIKLGKYVSIGREKDALDNSLNRVRYDKLLASDPISVPVVLEGMKSEDTLLEGSLLGNVVDMIGTVEDIVNPVSKQELKYIQEVEKIMQESYEIRERKFAQFLERAKQGDQIAMAALEFFYGIFYENGEFVEKEPVSGIAPEKLGYKVKQ